MAVIIDVAEAVKDEINATTFSRAIRAVRVRQKRRRTLEELVAAKEICCDVVHVGWSSDLEVRGADSFEPVVDIFLRFALVNEAQQDQATGDIPNEEIDPLEQLAEDVAMHFQPNQDDDDRTGRLASYDVAAWKSTKVATKLDARIWQAHIRLTFDV